MNGYTFNGGSSNTASRTRSARSRVRCADGPGCAWREHHLQYIYYDTADYRLIRASLEKPAYKEKLRLRSYGVTEPGGEVFLAEFAPAGANKAQSIFASRLANVRA